MANHNMRVDFFSERPPNTRRRIEIISEKSNASPHHGRLLWLITTVETNSASRLSVVPSRSLCV